MASKIQEKYGRYTAYTNNVMALVYVGAAILIIVVGLRGLGDAVGNISFIPNFLLDQNGHKISLNVVVFALFLEFTMILLLAFITFLTPHEANNNNENKDVFVQNKTMTLDLPNFREHVEKLKELAEDEKLMIKKYLDDFESISEKISRIQSKNIIALKSMKEELSK